MKRTRLFFQVKNASSEAPEKITSPKAMAAKQQTSSITLTESQLSFENVPESLQNDTSDETKVSKSKKLRATVDLEMMKEELRQLQDSPITAHEKEISSNRLQYSFFDVPCTELAQKLLGKILVRRLENGTILKGRIVETEAYLGEIDKASQTYQGKVTPRNLPMYMPPGTIYVYLTYGMYHCFNISSAEFASYILIRALEVLSETDYVELLRNSHSKIGKPVKLMIDGVKLIEPYELCNESWKICTAFAIDLDDLNYTKLWNSPVIWLENDLSLNSVSIVAAPIVQNSEILRPEKLLRFYVLGNGCAVLLRGIEPITGIDQMRSFRHAGSKYHKNSKRISKILLDHELCNGPSKLCIAFEIERIHCKYSICNYKSLWIENDEILEEPKIVESLRIGIDSAGPEWANKRLRYYIYGNTSVSRRDKKAEAELLSNS